MAMDMLTHESTHCLAIEALDKEQHRIEALRERDAQRNAMFQTTRRRSLDYKTLGSQCADNAQRRSEEKELDNKYAEMMKQAMLLGEIQINEDDEMRAEEKRRLRQDWAAHAALPKNNVEVNLVPVDPGRCGLASAQHLAGEDADSGKRKSRQHAQLARWSSQQQAIQLQKKLQEKEENTRWADWEHHVSNQRATMEREHKKSLALANQDLRCELMEQAAEKRAAAREEKEAEAEADAAELARMREHPVYNQTPQYLEDGRAPRDNYRGLTKSQLKRVYYENSMVQADTARIKAEEKRVDAVKDAEDRLALAAHENAEYDKARLREMDYERLRSDLDDQRKVEAQRKVEQRRDALGAFDGSLDAGILSKFGKSYR